MSHRKASNFFPLNFSTIKIYWALLQLTNRNGKLHPNDPNLIPKEGTIQEIVNITHQLLSARSYEFDSRSHHIKPKCQGRENRDKDI